MLLDKSIIGVKINKLTVISIVGLRGAVVAKCDCGNTIEAKWSKIKSNHTTSCGCRRIEMHTTHGLCKHPLYSTWEGMINRCSNSTHNKYHRYGGIGVTVCNEWRSDFKKFHDWAISNGWQKGLELDKDIINPGSKMYCPENCCFVTHKKNMRHRDNNNIIEFNNEKMCVSEWAERLNMPTSTLFKRLSRGWSIERAITESNKKIA